MTVNNADFKGFHTQKQEIELGNPTIRGSIPKWVSGAYIANGPAQFEIGQVKLMSWLDGFAMLKKFEFCEGQVHFQNKYLQSKQFSFSNAMNKLCFNEFATYASSNLAGRMVHMIKTLLKKEVYDNCNVNIMRLHTHYLALTESNQNIEFNPDNLSTLGPFQFNDTLQAQLLTAHPHWDSKRKETITIAIEIGKQITYHICKIAAESSTREIIASYVSNSLFYMHSFSITEHYVILFQSPLELSKYKLMVGIPFNKSMFWQTQRTSQFIIIDRRNNQQHRIETEVFICLHSANAYEHNSEIVLDLICYDTNENLYDDLALDNVRSEHPIFHQGMLKRFILNLNTHSCESTLLSDDIQEFPRLHYDACNGNYYRYLYTNVMAPEARFFNEIRKTDVVTGNIKTWKNDHYYFGEPVFIAKPNHQSEDDGIVLTLAYNATTQLSSLVCLDAKALDWIAEVHLPLALPFGLHGNFF